MPRKPQTLAQLEAVAKKRAAEHGITIDEAKQLVARVQGYGSWAALAAIREVAHA